MKFKSNKYPMLQLFINKKRIVIDFTNGFYETKNKKIISILKMTDNVFEVKENV